MRKWSVALCLFAVLSLAACGDSDDEGQQTLDEGFPLTIEGVGGQLVLEEPAARIASLSAHTTEILCTIGAADKLVAVDKFANCPDGSSEKPELDSFQPNLEAIVGIEPDLVLVAFDPSGLVDSLRSLDVPVVHLDLPLTLDGVLKQVEIFGRVSGREQEAAELIDSMQSRIDTVVARIEEVEAGPRILHELTDDYFTASPQSFIGDFYRLLKATNIAEGATAEYPQLTAEIILDRNPQVIILADEAAGVSADSVRSRPGWQVIDAVQNDRICNIDPDIVSRPGPRVVDALDALAECLYPELFP